jgi:hypothetical protein
MTGDLQMGGNDITGVCGGGISVCELAEPTQRWMWVDSATTHAFEDGSEAFPWDTIGEAMTAIGAPTSVADADINWIVAIRPGAMTGVATAGYVEDVTVPTNRAIYFLGLGGSGLGVAITGNLTQTLDSAATLPTGGSVRARWDCFPSCLLTGAMTVTQSAAAVGWIFAGSRMNINGALTASTLTSSSNTWTNDGGNWQGAFDSANTFGASLTLGGSSTAGRFGSTVSARRIQIARHWHFAGNVTVTEASTLTTAGNYGLHGCTFGSSITWSAPAASFQVDDATEYEWSRRGGILAGGATLVRHDLANRSNLAPARTCGNASDTLTGLADRDGITISAGDRILVIDTASALNLGVWIAASGAWTRALDNATGAVFAHGEVLTPVALGASCGGATIALRDLTTPGATLTIGTSSLTPAVYVADASYLYLDGSRTMTGALDLGGNSIVDANDCSCVTLSGSLTGNATTATALAANGANCGAGQWAAGVDASGASETCTADDDSPDTDAEVPDNLTLVLEQSVAPANSTEGRIQWDTDDDVIVVGDGVTERRIYGDITAVATTAPLTGGVTDGDATIAIPAATASVDGYMTQAYASIVDSLSEQNRVSYNNDSTVGATTVTLNTLVTQTNKVTQYRVYCLGRRDDNATGVGYRLLATFSNNGGTVTQLGTTDAVEQPSTSATTCEFTISGSNVLVRATGIAAETWEWQSEVGQSVR